MALLFSFCGGAFAAVIGSLAAFIICGVMALLGVISAMAGVDFNWFGLIPFGIFFGPHISFAGGAAAAAFAKKKGYLGSGKDIAKALISLKKPSVIIAGGIYGMLGYLINYGISTVMAGKIDTVAFTIVILGLITKFLYDADYKLSGLFHYFTRRKCCENDVTRCCLFRLDELQTGTSQVFMKVFNGFVTPAGKPCYFCIRVFKQYAYCLTAHITGCTVYTDFYHTLLLLKVLFL
jgi:hypothetical protein